MATLSDYVSGTISLTTGSVDFTGSATGWLLAAFKEGDTIIDITGATEFMGVIAEITSNTAGKLTKAWEGPDLVDAPYRMRYQADGSRVSAQARNLIELLGDGTLTSLAGLSGPGVIELLPGGGAQVVPKTDLVSGANYDVQVSDLAGRAVYDGQAEGFSVLVADVGDGRSAIYSKASNASADWTDPAYVTGPIGETPDVTIGTVTTGAPGTDVEVTATPITGGVELDFTIPAGEGFSAKGAYSGATAYAKGDVVRDAGSSWIALQATTGNAPPTLPTTSNAYWELLAQKGQDGTGTGDVVGPAGATDNRLAVYDGASGKLLKDGGKLVGDIVSGPAAAVDGDQVVFDTLSGKKVRSLGIADPMLSVSPIPIDMHFATLAGVGWSASEPGGIVSTTTTSMGAGNTLVLASITSFFVGQLICFVASDSQYYSAVIQKISGNTITLDRVPPVSVGSGASVYNFYRDDAHANLHGFACLADDAIRQATKDRKLVYLGTNPSQWVASGASTLTIETVAAYANPGSSVASERGVKVTGSVIGAGAKSMPVALNGGTYEAEVVVNPGNRTGGFSGVVDVSVIATFADGTTRTVGSFQSTDFGNSIINPRIRYRVAKGASVAVMVTSPASGPWTFYVGMIRHYRIGGSLRDLNRGRHVVFGDSWAAGGDFVARLTARLTRATVINKGQSGDTSAVALARFDADMAGTEPAFVWVILGTNDVYADVTSTSFQANLDAIIHKIQALGATPIVFNTSVCDLSYVPIPGPRLDASRQYALRSIMADQQSGSAGVQRGTYVATTSGTAIDFIAPAGVKRATVCLLDVSTTGSSGVIIQIGGSSGVVTTGYSGALGITLASSAVTVATAASGFQLVSSNASAKRSGSVVLSCANPSLGLWQASGVVSDWVGLAVGSIAGVVQLAGDITTLRVTTIGGTDTFDGGGVNVLWE